MWNERNERGVDGSPPCDECGVVLYPENRDIADVYLMTRRQVVTAGMGQPIDINILAVESVMNMRGLGNQIHLLRRVQRLWHHFNKKEDSK